MENRLFGTVQIPLCGYIAGDIIVPLNNRVTVQKFHGFPVGIKVSFPDNLVSLVVSLFNRSISLLTKNRLPENVKVSLSNSIAGYIIVPLNDGIFVLLEYRFPVKTKIRFADGLVLPVVCSCNRRIPLSAKN